MPPPPPPIYNHMDKPCQIKRPFRFGETKLSPSASWNLIGGGGWEGSFKGNLVSKHKKLKFLHVVTGMVYDSILTVDLNLLWLVGTLVPTILYHSDILWYRVLFSAFI